MKNYIFLVTLSLLYFASCEKHNETVQGEGLEIYFTKDSSHYDNSVDYNSVDLGKISLNEKPAVLYSEIISVNTATGKIMLNITDSALRSVGSAKQMFVVTLDKTPMYCGFIQYYAPPPAILPPPINWVYIQLPTDMLSNQYFYLSFNQSNNIDPRFSKKIIDRLSADEKILQ